MCLHVPISMSSPAPKSDCSKQSESLCSIAATDMATPPKGMDVTTAVQDVAPRITYLSPPRLFHAIVKVGAEKALMPWWKVFWLAILAGAYIGLGAAFFLSVGGQMPGVQSTNLGLQKLVLGAFGLPMSLGLILVCGAELLTANSAYISAAVFECVSQGLQLPAIMFYVPLHFTAAVKGHLCGIAQGQASVMHMMGNLAVCFLGNLVGSLLIVGLTYSTHLFEVAPAALTYAETLSHTKAYAGWGHVMARGFLCNWLVVLAVWQAAAAQDIIGKLAAVFFPVMAFVSTGYDHVVANMFIIPFGIRLGNHLPIGHYIVYSMIPTFLGNFLSSVFMVSFTYSMCYGTLPDRIGAWLTSWNKQPRLSNHSAAKQTGTAYGVDSV